MPRISLRDQFDDAARRELKPKIVARNTFKYQDGADTVYRLHGTDVVRRKPDGSVVLNSGGWKTVITKERINSYIGAGRALIQEGGQWYVCNSSYPWSDKNTKRVPYFDGIQVPQCFNKPNGAGAKIEAREIKLRAQIRKFVAKLDKLECLPEPSQGDCWYCMMKTQDGKSLGEATNNDVDHIREHVREGYLHGSLILNALKWAGYPNPGLIWHMENQDMQRGKRPSMVKRALKRYLCRKLGLVS